MLAASRPGTGKYTSLLFCHLTLLLHVLFEQSNYFMMICMPSSLKFRIDQITIYSNFIFAPICWYQLYIRYDVFVLLP